MSNLPVCHFLPSESLEREAHRRGDEEWLRQRLTDSAQFIFVWRGCSLFGVGEEKQPLSIEMHEPGEVLSPVFLGILANGEAIFAADLSTRESEQEALNFLNLTTEQARFTALREFDGTLSPEQRSLLFYSRSMTHWHQEQKFCSRCSYPTLR